MAVDGECITVSMGFRAPSHRSMLIAFCDHVSQTRVAEGDLYADVHLKPQKSAGTSLHTAKSSLCMLVLSVVPQALYPKRLESPWAETSAER